MNESEQAGKDKRPEQFTFLFLVQGGKVATYRLLEIAGRGAKLDLIPSGGHDFQRFDDDFWGWWRHQFDFVPEGVRSISHLLQQTQNLKTSPSPRISKWFLGRYGRDNW